MSPSMELNRRDAVIALLASGIGVASSGALLSEAISSDPDPRLTEADMRTLVAVGQVVYPSEVTVTAEFVRTYVLGKAEDSESHLNGVLDAIAELERFSKRHFQTAFAAASESNRDTILRSMGVDNVTADPDGTVPHRVRHYLVTDLLYALYTSPVGGRLLGNENPIGHPGGLSPYQRGPNDG